ncbi:hypothetical protein CCP3SC1_30007 [Gammaproteobacteria bacterium]
MFQSAGEKGEPHSDPEDHPRVRANKKPGIGTLATDRPPIQGVVGRGSGQIRLTVCENTQQKTIQPEVGIKTKTRTTFYTDESSAYNKVRKSGRKHGAECAILVMNMSVMMMVMA